ncbi:MAG TPA: hypothetical protein VKA19_10010 [Alphaproteobacteria bacterium]|nr:hypothetical protein [Alphaproteobacteria bacterium]
MTTLRTLAFSVFSLTLLATGLAGCGNDSGPIYYQAVCSRMHGIVRGWEGPKRAHRADALRDAEGHREAYPDHVVTIEQTH